uniref:Uncharacterized protein n=1 Tax=Siphoviridae sp. ctXQq5 TaxID=2826368 RepID=A0A8S5N190_9CAUD|nr:MAG TPA: hypothetical protein [Siphoviridae sp. ctXQq5]
MLSLSCHRLQSCINFWAKSYSEVTKKKTEYQKSLVFDDYVYIDYLSEANSSKSENICDYICYICITIKPLPHET